MSLKNFLLNDFVFWTFPGFCLQTFLEDFASESFFSILFLHLLLDFVSGPFFWILSLDLFSGIGLDLSSLAFLDETCLARSSFNGENTTAAFNAAGSH